MKYIHIGYSRTGTTWLQKVVFPEWMRDEDVLFLNLAGTPDFHQTPSGKILVSYEGIGAHAYHTHTVEDALENMVHLFGRDVKVIISVREGSHESVYNSLVTSFKKINIPIRMGEDEFWRHDDIVQSWLNERDIDYVKISIKNFPRDVMALAEFMGIGPPSHIQVAGWLKTVVNKDNPQTTHPLTPPQCWSDCGLRCGASDHT